MAHVHRETYQSKLLAILEEFIAQSGLKGERSQVINLFRSLTQESLLYPITERLPPFSWICMDGTPIQFSISLTKHPPPHRPLRYVTEVSSPVMPLIARVNLTRKRLPVLLADIGATHLNSQIDTVLNLLLPPSLIASDHSLFGVWIGVQHRRDKHPLVKLYLNLMPEKGESWTRLDDVLRLLDHDDLRRTILTLREWDGSFCHPAAVGIAFAADGFHRMQLYLRGYHADRSQVLAFLEKLGLSGFERELSDFHQYILDGQESYSNHSLVLSVGSHRESGGVCDAKVEVGATFYLRNDQQAYERVLKLAHQLELDPSHYDQMFGVLAKNLSKRGCLCLHDIISIGFDPRKGPRIGVYFKPHLSGLCSEVSVHHL